MRGERISQLKLTEATSGLQVFAVNFLDEHLGPFLFFRRFFIKGVDQNVRIQKILNAHSSPLW